MQLFKFEETRPLSLILKSNRKGVFLGQKTQVLSESSEALKLKAKEQEAKLRETVEATRKKTRSFISEMKKAAEGMQPESNPNDVRLFL